MLQFIEENKTRYTYQWHRNLIFFLFRIKQNYFNQTSTGQIKNRKIEGTEIFFRFPLEGPKGHRKKISVPLNFSPLDSLPQKINSTWEPKFFFGSPHFFLSSNFRPDSKFNFSQTATWNFVFFISN